MPGMQSIPCRILTGKYPANHGITRYVEGHRVRLTAKKAGTTAISPSMKKFAGIEITLAEAMRDAGYKTFFAGVALGKQGFLADHGFEINMADVGGPRGGFFSPYNNLILRTDQKENPLPSGWVRNCKLYPITKDSEQPFLAYLPFPHAPFRPRNPSTRNIGQSKKDGIR